MAKDGTIMANMKYALSGAAGAVGKALAARLAKRGESFRAVAIATPLARGLPRPAWELLLL